MTLLPQKVISFGDLGRADFQTGEQTCPDCQIESLEDVVLFLSTSLETLFFFE